MQFKPKSEKEISEENLLPNGEYDFEVTAALDAKSASGNEMIKLQLNVFDDNGNLRIIFDYLLESMAFKLRHAADACGVIDKYESGSLVADDFMGKTGRLKLAIQKDKTGDYPDKNTVRDYIKREAEGVIPAGLPALDDTIPF